MNQITIVANNSLFYVQEAGRPEAPFVALSYCDLVERLSDLLKIPETERPIFSEGVEPMNEPKPKKRTATQQEIRDLLDLLQERVAKRVNGDARRANGHEWMIMVDELRKAPPDRNAETARELEAMQVVLDAIQPLSPAQRNRVVQWATEAARSNTPSTIDTDYSDD